MSQVAQQVNVRARTWLHQSLNLFDFEAAGSAVSSESFVMSSTGTCGKMGGHIMCVDSRSGMSAMKALLKFRPTVDGVEISPTRHAAGTSQASRPWIVVQDLPQAASRIVEGDTIMLGRATVDVKQIVRDSAEATPINRALFSESVCWCEDEMDESMQCRICLMNGASEADPFVRPCECRGSIENVHLSCLRQWTKTRLNLPEGPTDSFTFHKPTCEMCKADYPTFVVRNGETEALVDALPSVQAPYMVLESVAKSSKGRPKEKRVAFHVVSFAGGDLVKIGRGHESQVRLDEVSLSRWHASLRHSDGEFFVEDHQSKFGTLVAMRRSWMLDPEQPISIKLGRTVLSFALPSPAASEMGSPSHASSSDAMSSPSSASRNDQLDLDMHGHGRKSSFDSVRDHVEGEDDAVEIQYQ